MEKMKNFLIFQLEVEKKSQNSLKNIEFIKIALNWRKNCATHAKVAEKLGDVHKNWATSVKVA